MSRLTQTALGISTGDIVRTSYRTGPYEVWSIWGPKLWYDGSCVVIMRYPVMSLTLVKPGMTSPKDHDFYFINNITRIGDRWFMARDELFVEHRAPVGQLDLFGPVESTPEPYPFQAGVDYAVKPGELWQCQGCRRDFHGPKVDRFVGSRCPDCGRIGKPILIFPEMQAWPEEGRHLANGDWAAMMAWNNRVPVERLEEASHA